MVRDLLLEIIFVNSGDAMLGSGCSQEHPDLKKKIIYIYINLNFIICLTIKKKKKEHPQQNQEHSQHFYDKQILK